MAKKENKSKFKQESGGTFGTADRFQDTFSTKTGLQGIILKNRANTRERNDVRKRADSVIKHDASKGEKSIRTASQNQGSRLTINQIKKLTLKDVQTIIKKEYSSWNETISSAQAIREGYEHYTDDEVVRKLFNKLPDDVKKRLEYKTTEGTTEIAFQVQEIFNDEASILRKKGDDIKDEDMKLSLARILLSTKDFDVRKFDDAKKSKDDLLNKVKTALESDKFERFLTNGRNEGTDEFIKLFNSANEKLQKMTEETILSSLQNPESIIRKYQITANTSNNLEGNLPEQVKEFIEKTIKEGNTSEENYINLLAAIDTVMKIKKELTNSKPAIPIGILDVDAGDGLSGVTKNHRIKDEGSTDSFKEKPYIYLNLQIIKDKLQKNSTKYSELQASPIDQLGTLFHELSHAFNHDNDKTDISKSDLKGGHAKPEDVYKEDTPQRWFLDPDFVAAILLDQLSKSNNSNSEIVKKILNDLSNLKNIQAERKITLSSSQEENEATNSESEELVFGDDDMGY